MSFSADWLALRADADARARDTGLQAALAASLPDRPIRVLDLGSGTGANMNALAPVLRQAQTWVLTDNDPKLLDRASAPDRVTLETRVADLFGDLSALFDPAPDLVTASAFFDLCGPEMIDRIIAAVTASSAAFYTVLTYDGREIWAPPHPLDAQALPAFHKDQKRDKGLGPSLGPDAVAYMRDGFSQAGFQVQTAPSDWQLQAPRDTDLIAELARGSASAITPTMGQDLAAEWHAARRLATGVMIGHQDFLALPGNA